MQVRQGISRSLLRPHHKMAIRPNILFLDNKKNPANKIPQTKPHSPRPPTLNPLPHRNPLKKTYKNPSIQFQSYSRFCNHTILCNINKSIYSTYRRYEIQLLSNFYDDICRFWIVWNLCLGMRMMWGSIGVGMILILCIWIIRIVIRFLCFLIG